jgi:hypothetical protein
MTSAAALGKRLGTAVDAMRFDPSIPQEGQEETAATANIEHPTCLDVAEELDVRSLHLRDPGGVRKPI